VTSTSSADSRYRERSLWLEAEPGSLAPRPHLDGDTEVDVAIVGGGYTGLWTAYYLLKADPALRVVVIERDIVGFGASGRNGGWCVGEIAGGYDAMVRAVDHNSAVRLMRAGMDAVNEVGRVAKTEGIDCDFVKGGTIRVARNGAQLISQREEVEHHHSLGFGEDDIRILGVDEARARLDATNILGGVHFAHTARVQPARLVRGLADTVEKLGGRIVESTEATAIEPGSVSTSRGRVKAEMVVRATEGYTKSIAGHARTLVPLYSLMIATEPLDADTWAAIGLAERETFSDDRHMVIYGQRTADDRIAFGGRGAPYGYASRIDQAIEQRSKVHDLIIETLHELLPQTASAGITHRWGGVLGVPRNWFPSVGLDLSAGLAWGGGYVGEGVAISNLAGRTLADLIGHRSTELTGLPWVHHHSRRWPIEPFRWLGINGALHLMGMADQAENKSGEPSRTAKILGRLLR